MSRLLLSLFAIASLTLAAPRSSSATASRAAKSPAAGSATRPAPTASARSAAKRPKKPPRNGPVVLYHINSHDTIALRPRDLKARPAKVLQRRVDRFLRCHHTGVQHPMNPRLVRLIYQTGRHWPGHRIDVVSGYRNPTVAKNPHSPHMKGLACDFRIEGVKDTELRDYLRRTFDKVGVGYYPNSSFVHLDVRKDRSAFWIDYSGPGERAVYSENPQGDLRSGRADQYKPTKIDQSWVDDGAKDDRSKGEEAAEPDENPPETPKP